MEYDLIAWDYAGRLEKIASRLGSDHYVWRQALLDVLIFYQNDKEYLANLLRHTSGHDSFIQYMTDINIAALTAHIRDVSGAAAFDQKMELLIRFYCIATVNLSCEWILGKVDINAEELAHIFEDALPLPLRPLLLP
ncbi:MAG: TetR family transcriptional regulator C-terminal domain-containing protein [Lachnospiraceae bacterium]|nr:TetR family transcriptional regulator C-terminal domain-containing protein [Lachnospiraceae bacterium]